MEFEQLVKKKPKTGKIKLFKDQFIGNIVSGILLIGSCLNSVSTFASEALHKEILENAARTLRDVNQAQSSMKEMDDKLHRVQNSASEAKSEAERVRNATREASIKLEELNQRSQQIQSNINTTIDRVSNQVESRLEIKNYQVITRAEQQLSRQAADLRDNLANQNARNHETTQQFIARFQNDTNKTNTTFQNSMNTRADQFRRETGDNLSQHRAAWERKIDEVTELHRQQLVDQKADYETKVDEVKADFERASQVIVDSVADLAANGVEVRLNNQALKKSARIVGQEVRVGLLGAFEPIIRELSQLMQDARERPHVAIAKVAVAAGMIGGTIYTTKILYEVVRDYIMTPPLEIKRTESIFQRVLNKVKGVKPTVASINDLSLDSNIKEQLTRYERSLVQSMKNDVELPNAILTGPPGTGKTYAVEAMAQKNGLTFVKMSGSSFKKYPKAKAIAIMDQLFSWAHRKGRVVIFIDEIENLLASREGDHASSGDFDILNNFLAHTGTRSKRFVIVGTTNVPNLLDAAMGRRFDEMIEFKLPGLEERADMLNRYIKKILFTKMIGIKVQNSFLTSDYIAQIAEQTDHLSGGELEGIIVRARQVALSTPGKVLNQNVFSKLVDESIKKHNRLVLKTTKTTMAA